MSGGLNSRFSALVLVAVVACLVLLPAEGSAQCSMCRTALEQNEEAAVGFNRAILFLLAMPYSVFASLAGYVFISRRRRAGVPIFGRASSRKVVATPPKLPSLEGLRP